VVVGSVLLHLNLGKHFRDSSTSSSPKFRQVAKGSFAFFFLLSLQRLVLSRVQVLQSHVSHFVGSILYSLHGFKGHSLCRVNPSFLTKGLQSFAATLLIAGEFTLHFHVRSTVSGTTVPAQ